MKEIWIFLAYKKESDYPLNPYIGRVFDDFDVMKEYSTDHSSREKEKYPEYVSTYVKTEL